MSKRGISILLILTAAIALGALMQDYRFDGLLQTERTAASALDADLNHTTESVMGLIAAQSAYLADGQGPTEWLSRVTRLEDDIGATIDRRRPVASDSDSTSLYDAAAEALAGFKRVDTQIRSSISQGDRLRASDLLFKDSAAASRLILDSLTSAHDRDRRAIDAGISRLAQLRLAMNGVALLFALAIALYFGRFIAVMAVRGEPTTAQMLKELPPPVKTGGTAAHATAASLPAVVATPAHPAHAAPTHSNVSANLAAAAELCVDLSRVLDSSDVPALLERTATLLEARGIMIWAIDSDGARLRPALSHGYADKVLKKLRPLQIDGDNVTSLACRSLQPQVMNGATPNDAAAIAIPLLTGTGCVGVMAAELRHNRPHADLLPVARILGAQFSTLIAVPDESIRRSAQG